MVAEVVVAEPKYSSAEVKLMVMAVEDLHKDRFRSGWFHMLRFSEAVATKPELLDELKKFSKENTILPDEWTEPVVILNKNHKVAAAAPGKNKPKLKPFGLQIGVEEDSKMRPNPHSNFPPPQVPIK